MLKSVQFQDCFAGTQSHAETKLEIFQKISGKFLPNTTFNPRYYSARTEIIVQRTTKDQG